MTLKFLPVQTPSTVGILVLTRDKYLQSEIEFALHQYQYIFCASNINEANNIISKDPIGIFVIDINTLESDDTNLISEILSLSPELILVPFLEAGSTHDLVALSDKYNVYHYLKMPCARKQIANFINSAVKKYLKQFSNKDIEDKDSSSLTPFSGKKHIAAIAVAITLILLLTTNKSSTENNEQEQVLTQNQQLDSDNINNIIHDNPSLTIPTEIIPVLDQAKLLADNTELDTTNETLLKTTTLPGQSRVEISTAKSYISTATEQSSQFNEFLEKAQIRLNSDNLSKPTDDSAKFYLSSLKKMAPENDKITSLVIELADKLLELANTAINENNISKAKYFLQETKTLDVRAEIISRLEKKIIAQKQNKADAASDIASVSMPALPLPDPPSDTIQERIEKQEKINALLTSARKSYVSEEYFSPENNNASHFLLLAKKIDEQNEDITYSLIELADKTLSMIKAKLADKQIAEASALINHVKQLGVRTEEIGKIEQEAN